MDRQWKWRALGIVGLIIASILMLVPTAMAPTKAEELAHKERAAKGEEVPPVLPEWFTKIFSKKLALGLDLQGGIHLQYLVKVDEALHRRSSQLAGSVETTLEKELGVKAKATALVLEGAYDSDQASTIKVTFQSETDAEKLDVSFLSRYFNDYEIADVTGSVVTLVMSDTAISTFKTDAVEKAIETVERRVNEFGVTESTVNRHGDAELVVQIPGLSEHDFAAAKEKLATTGQLHFQMVDRDAGPQWYQKVAERIPTADAWPDRLDPKLKIHKTVRGGGRIRSTSREILEYIAEGQLDGEHLVGYQEMFVDPNDSALSAIETLSKQQEKILSKRKAFDPEADVVKGYELVYMFTKRGMTGENVIDASVGFDKFNRPEVYMQFAPVDADEFYQMTKVNVGELMAIMIDEVVFSAPRIKEPIPGGRVRIEMGSVGSQALKESTALVAVLKSGALQAPLQKLYDSQVGPTLGSDSIEAGKVSVAVGFGAVVIFMIIYYGFAGFVADIALLLNLLFVMAVLTSFGATLTLPGIAGIVLTVGMAVDANVLIFERIREELRTGKPVRQSIDLGYEKAMSAIVDANVTTAIAAAVLYQTGTGPIRGFAVTLGVGIVCSVFTALVVTRLIFAYAYGRGVAPERMSIGA